MNFSKKTVKKTYALNDMPVLKAPGLKQYQIAAESNQARPLKVALSAAFGVYKSGCDYEY